MNPRETIDLTRRDFLATAASGLGTLALASLFRADGLLATESALGHPPSASPAAPPHFAPRAKACIFFFMEGGPSQMDLFDPKP